MTYIHRRDPFRARAENSGIDKAVAQLLDLFLRNVPTEVRALAHMQIVDIISAASRNKGAVAPRTKGAFAPRTKGAFAPTTEGTTPC